VSRGTRELHSARSINFTYRTITFCGSAFQQIQLFIDFLTCRGNCNFLQRSPTTPNIQRLQAWHIFGLGWSHFARRYFENRVCFLFLRVLRCFSSPRLLLLPMYSVINFTELPVMGFPIQKSPDQSLFSSSPKLIAASHVFHRHSAPRHPPFALSSLAIINHKKLLYLKYYKAPYNIFYSVFSCQRTKSRLRVMS
jgi:hypothetical protein